MKKELEEFQKFKKQYCFKQKEIKIVNGLEYCEEEPLLDENGRGIGECDKWINVGYNHKGLYSKALSNLFSYEFIFRGKKLKSIESFFQGIKFKDINIQNIILGYSGIESTCLKVCNEYDWRKTGTLYWQGNEFNRYNKEYNDLVDEVYICALQNPLYRNVLKTCNKDIIHSIGKKEMNETVFTRYEFELELNCLKEYLKTKQ